MKKTIALLLALTMLLALTACGAKSDDKTITVAASPTPHAEILKAVADVLNEEGWTLKIVEYADYVVPNNVVEDGEMDANSCRTSSGVAEQPISKSFGVRSSSKSRMAPPTM